MTTSAPPAPTLADPGDHAEDVAAIEALIGDVAAGLAAQDPDACIARFAGDARSVITGGRRGVGRDAIRRAHVEAFATGAIPGTPHFALLDVLFVADGRLAIATTEARRAGTDGPTTVVTWTLVRQADGWWIAARQFTPVTS